MRGAPKDDKKPLNSYGNMNNGIFNFTFSNSTQTKLGTKTNYKIEITWSYSTVFNAISRTIHSDYGSLSN